MLRKKLKGKIKSISGAKTVKVEVVRAAHHPLYRKRLLVTKTYLAHFEGEAEVGQEVVIEESRPLSARKRWVVVELGGKTLEGGTQGSAFVERSQDSRPFRGAKRKPPQAEKNRAGSRGRRFRKSTTRVPKEKKQ